MQKITFYTAKSNLLQRKRLPLATAAANRTMTTAAVACSRKNAVKRPELNKIIVFR